MDRADVIQKLAEIEALETWGDHCGELGASERQHVYHAAEQLWIERMARKGRLLVHPDVLQQLESQSWRPNDLQKRMIWASVLASAEGSDSKERFRAIKEKLLRRYGRDWWEDVFKRKTSAWAAKERIRKTTGSYGAVITVMINNTHLFSGLADEERVAALKMIPKE